MSLDGGASSRSEDIREKVFAAFAALRADFTRAASWKYPGALDADESWGWLGPWAWSEADIQHRFATFLEQQFGVGAVHLEMPINERMRSDLDPLPPDKKRRATTFIDLVVADLAELSGLPQTADGAGAAFRARRHEAFIEVKWRNKAAATWFGLDYKTFSDEVASDLERLHLHHLRGRCSVAALLFVDNDGRYWPKFLSEHQVPNDVLQLVLAPPAQVLPG